MSFYRLLDVLATRKDPSGLSGNVWVHKVLEDADFQCDSGYVLQVSISEFFF